MSTLHTYRLGQFKRADAATWDFKKVDLTTHPGEKTGEGNQSFEGVTFLHVPGRDHALLGKARPGDGHVEAVGAVFFHEIATMLEVTA